jgi:hypothetical protein
MKKLFLFLLISSCYLSYSQTVDILLYNYGSTPVVSQPLITQAYGSAGFNVVNLDYADIDASLNVNNYDVLIVHEGYVNDSNLNQWVANPLNETKRVLIENFVTNGGHVVWVSESNQSVFPNKSNITINNIYGTNLQNEGWNGLYQNNLASRGVYVLKLLINRKVYTQSFTVMSAN